VRYTAQCAFSAQNRNCFLAFWPAPLAALAVRPLLAAWGRQVVAPSPGLDTCVTCTVCLHLLWSYSFVRPTSAAICLCLPKGYGSVRGGPLGRLLSAFFSLLLFSIAACNLRAHAPEARAALYTSGVPRGGCPGTCISIGKLLVVQTRLTCRLGFFLVGVDLEPVLVYGAEEGLCTCPGCWHH
jgi:hypothetical protein